MLRPRAQDVVIGATALAVLITPLAYAVAAHPAGSRFGPYFALHAALMVLALVAWAALGRVRKSRNGLVAVVVVAGIAARLLLVFVPSFTSTDVSRYLWDGAVALDGNDPYALEPAAPALTNLRAQFPPPTDHTDVPTCYPPLAIAIFSACASLGPSLAWLGWKLLLALASSLAVLLAWWHLRATEQARNVALLALGPTSLLEAGVGGHLDTLTALAVLAAIVAFVRGHERTAALALGTAAALKILPGLLVIVLLARSKRRLEVATLFALPIVLSVGVALALGVTPIGSLLLVARTWSFGSPVWTWLVSRWPGEEDAIRLGLLTMVITGIALVAWRQRHVAVAARDALGVSLAFSPTLYPWYAMPLASVATLAPSTWSLALLSVLPASYEVIDGYQSSGAWAPATWPIALTALALTLGPLIDQLAPRLAKQVATQPDALDAVSVVR